MTARGSPGPFRWGNGRAVQGGPNPAQAREYATRIRLGEPTKWEAIDPDGFAGVYKFACGAVVWDEAEWGLVSNRELLEALDYMAAR